MTQTCRHGFKTVVAGAFERRGVWAALVLAREAPAHGVGVARRRLNFTWLCCVATRTRSGSTG
jgi:hypothetical protein